MIYIQRFFWHNVYPMLKKIQLYSKGYHFITKSHEPACLPHAVVVHMTNSTNVSGLADRIKCFVTSYIIAKENGYEFKIHHTNGFKLNSYLVPNKIDWSISESQISYGLSNARIAMILYKIPKLSKAIRQWHIYAAQNIIPYLPNNKSYSFHEIFWELFKPSRRLENLINSSLSSALGENWQSQNFIAVHIRFLDYLEKVENTKTRVTTSHEDKMKMIYSVISSLNKIHGQHPDSRILIFTDSPSFLKADLPEYISTLDGCIGHISTHRNSQDITDKAFLDLFVIAKSKTVYNIIGPGLYSSQFSEVGALIGNVPFIRIKREV